MKRIFIASTLFFTALCSLYGYANENHGKNSESDLSQVSYFSLGMNGFVGRVSEGEVAVIDILKSKSATDIFLRIANNPKATPESKLYAACGLKQLDKLNDNDVRSIFEKEWDDDVSILKADILRKEKFKGLYFGILNHGCM
ncbi:MchS3 family protein [Serratia entomophila]|uniref:MchS3 family protein n=1 Tax=Serratia entomophila TaxID=42906 RepID=UPI0021BAA716|nr:MchS3 family protein [Serratia entomophila]